MSPEMLWKLVVVTTIAIAVTAHMEPHNPNSVDEGRGKKEEKMIQQMIQAMMLAKNMVSFALMFVSPIIQIKGFGLSVVNTLINIGRFLVQLQATQHMKQMHMAHLKVHYEHAHQTHESEDLWSSASDSLYAYYAPPPRQPLRDPGVRENLPAAQPSYTSAEQQHHVYPHFSSNLSRIR